jgi:hypothetical protein
MHMTIRFSNRWLGASLLVLAVTLAIVGVRSVTSLQSVMIKAYLAEGAGGAIEQMVTAWPYLVLPLIACLSVASGGVPNRRHPRLDWETFPQLQSGELEEIRP